MSGKSDFHIRTYANEDEWPHKPSGHPQWQESVAFTWWDDERGIGGFHRLGHELGAPQPAVNNWNGIFTREGTRFHRNVDRKMQPGDQIAHGFGCLPLSLFDSKNSPTYTLTDPQCSLALECEDFYPRSDLFPTTAGSMADDFASSHFEVACRVRGKVRLDSRDYAVDGLGYRDHSWGKRDWTILLSHRWIAGTFGRDLSFCAVSWHGTDGTLRNFGILVRDGKVIPAERVDILAYVEADATTCRGGRVEFFMPGGERLCLEPKPIDAMISYHKSIANVDTLCTVEHEGRAGFCDFEMSSNPRRGVDRITPLLRANDKDGISRRPW